MPTEMPQAPDINASEEFNLDQNIPEDGLTKFKARIEELKQQGYTDFRTEFCAVNKEDDLATEIKNFKGLGADEEIVSDFVHQDDIEDAGDSEQAADILYVLVAKKS